jgi:hypothetical protein
MQRKLEGGEFCILKNSKEDGLIGLAFYFILRVSVFIYIYIEREREMCIEKPLEKMFRASIISVPQDEIIINRQ